MENKFVLGCVNGYPPFDVVIDYASWLSLASEKELKLFHTLNHQYHENSADLSGSIGLGAKEELLSEIVEIEHQQNKLLQQKAKLILESAKNMAMLSGVKSVDLCLRRGKLIENLLDLQDKISVAVIGKYGKSHQGANPEDPKVGHNVEALVRSLKKPILIVSEKFTPPKSLCLAFDGSAPAHKALDFICAHKAWSALEIHVVLVGAQTPENRQHLDQALAALRLHTNSPQGHIIEGDTFDCLQQYVSDQDISILAMGAFGHNWLHDFVMGSLTSQIIKNIQRPLLLLR